MAEMNTETMSDTLETDAESARIFELTASPGEIFCEWEKFARKLERERDQALADLSETAAFRDAACEFWDEANSERDRFKSIVEGIGDIMHVMRPRFVGTPTMDGKYPCWIVWLPNEGSCERKNLSDAILEFVEQSKSIEDKFGTFDDIKP